MKGPYRAGGGSVQGFFCRGKFRTGNIPHLSPKIKGKIPHLPNLECIASKGEPAIVKFQQTTSGGEHSISVPENLQSIRTACTLLLMRHQHTLAPLKWSCQEKNPTRSYSGLHRHNSAWGKFRTSPRKMRGKFRTKLKYGISPAENSRYGIPPPPPVRN